MVTSEAQSPHFVAEALDVAELDLLVASDHIGQPGKLHRPLVALRRETDQRLFDEGPILADQLPLDPAHRSEPEGIERRAAQHLHAGQHTEDRAEPRAELELLLETERAEHRRVGSFGRTYPTRGHLSPCWGPVAGLCDTRPASPW